MEPAACPPEHHYHRRDFEPTQPLADRVIRALQHRLRLLHRSDATFFVLGSTGNVYTVNLSSSSCTCPDRTAPCKHILFVLIRVLRVSPDDSCLWRRTLRPCQLARLLATPSSSDALAGAAVSEVFRRMAGGNGGPAVEVVAEDGAACPVCLEEMGKSGEKLVACGTCRNVIHEECLKAWKRSSRRRSASCVLCRARWRNAAEQDKYLNLSPYIMSGDDEGHNQNQGHCR